MFIWLASLALSISALSAMAVLILARIVRQLRDASRERSKRALTQALLSAAEGNSSPLSMRRLGRREKGILVGAGIELLDLVRGAMALRIVQVLTDCGINEVLARWIESPNPLRRAAAAR